jgi:quercetin dioxygenase-like cupin family protein
MTPHTETSPSGTHVSWEDVPVEHIADGIERQMVVGQRLMICRLRFRPHVETPVHSHPHEQITLVEKGRVRFVIGDTTRIAAAGDVLSFPSGVVHGTTILDEEAVLLDIFTPLREEFLTR